LESVSKTADAQIITNSYSYANDRISSIAHNGFAYNFKYNPLGSNTEVKVGNQNLITNTYEPRTGKLLGSTYGNNQTTALVYDSEDRVIARNYGGIEKFTYAYDASGNVAYHGDKVNGSKFASLIKPPAACAKTNFYAIFQQRDCI
jgi:YD repeat-containing protein